MRQLKLTAALLAVTIVAAGCGGSKNETPQKETPKTLVLYYSLTNNTKQVAEEIASLMGADIERIEAVEPYDTAFQPTIERCMKEREQGVLPQIQPLNADLSQYDVIFIGYPVWFGTYAPPVITFLTNNDLSGKKIVPFCTFGSGGLESSVSDLEAAQPNAEVLPGYGVRAARLEAMPKEVEQFLVAGGFIEGEYTAPEPFGEIHEVSEEETAVFNAAVDGYPMLNAEAKTVASRPIADGTEYLFTAVDKPRKGDPKMSPENEVQVYVTVINGQSPVFTRVVR